MNNWMYRTVCAAGMVCAASSVGCGDVARQGRGPTQAAVVGLLAASGATPDTFGGSLSSDVETVVERTINQQMVRVPTIFGDIGKATLSVIAKDQSGSALSAPSALNDVVFTRYRVVYSRSDGRNTPGVDVPYPIDSAVTVSAGVNGTAEVAFELVRVTAKMEAPLRALVVNTNTFIGTVAEVTFYGQDRAGNQVTASGSIGITFGNFGDPTT